MAAGKQWRVAGWPAVFLFVIPWWVGFFVIARATVTSLF